MPPKFQPGELVRIGGAHRPLPKYYFWLKRGQLRRVVSVQGFGAGRHALYGFKGSKCRPPAVLSSYDLRYSDQRFRRSGGGRKPRSNKVSN